MEAAASVASLVGVAGTVKICIDLFDIITTASNTNEDIKTLITFMNTERMRFLLWCTLTRFAELAALVDQQQSPAGISNSYRDTDNASRMADLLLPQLKAGFFLNHVVLCMEDMKAALVILERLVTPYISPGTPSFLGILRRRSLAARSHPLNSPQSLALPEVIAAISEASSLNLSHSSGVRTSVLRRIVWATADRKEADRALGLLRQHNDGLQAITDQFQQLRSRYQRGADAAFSECSGPAMLTTESTSNSQQDRAKMLQTISLMGSAVEDIGLNYDEEPPSKTPESLPTIMDDDMLLSWSRLQVPDSDSDSSTNPHRSYGHYNDSPVVVEWRYYSSQLTGEGRSLLDARIALLVSILQRSRAISTFHTLQCRGYLEQASERRYGLVFAYPSQNTTPMTLRDRLVQDYKARQEHAVQLANRPSNNPARPEPPQGPDLGDRLQLARSLASSMYQFFLAHWLHKNIRSSSIMFFEETRSINHLPPMYFGGFGFVRRNLLVEATENLPSALHSVVEDKEWQLYVHPDLNDIRRRYPETTSSHSSRDHQRRSNLLWDTYGLGIILLEIALWAPVIKICSRKQSVQEFQLRLRERYHEDFGRLVRFNMGDRYSQVVSRCLSGEIGAALDCDGEDLAAPRQRAEFLGAFERLVVSELEEQL